MIAATREAKADLAAWLGKWSVRHPRLTSWVEETIEQTLTFFRLPRRDERGNSPACYGDSAPRIALTAASAVRVRVVLTNSGQLDRTTAAKSAIGSM